PFDAIEAIAHSAKLLRDLRREFGNLGLAAAASNAGPGRVRGWLAGRRGLPRETDAYVRIVTGQSPEQWARGQAGPAETHVAHAVPCQQIAALVARAPAPEMKPLDPWGVQLVGSSSDATALAAYHRLQEKYAAILGGREPRVLHHGLARGSMGSHAAAWVGRGSTSGRRPAPAPRNCAPNCVPPARAARCCAIEPHRWLL